MMTMYDWDHSESPKSQDFTIVVVKNPIIHYSWDNKRYTSYEISLKSNDNCFSLSSSSVRRRFSDFIVLRKLLQFQHQNVTPPSLPSRNFFRNRFSIEFIEQRGKELEEFLQKLLGTPLYLSSTAFHLFLQSNLSMTDIEAIASGKLPSPLDNASKLSLTTKNDSLTSRDAQCQTYFDDEGETTGESPSTHSNSISINSNMEPSPAPVLPCTINRHVISEQACSFGRRGSMDKEASSSSSFGSTHSFP